MNRETKPVKQISMKRIAFHAEKSFSLHSQAESHEKHQLVKVRKEPPRQHTWPRFSTASPSIRSGKRLTEPRTWPASHLIRWEGLESMMHISKTVFTYPEEVEGECRIPEVVAEGWRRHSVAQSQSAELDYLHTLVVGQAAVPQSTAP